jgi:hypothetical protein
VRIVGYLPQHFSVVPQVGMPVEVRTRGLRRASGCATILGVSPYLESITNSLVAPLAVRPVITAPLGRKVTLSLPSDLNLVPGEPVDLRLIEKSAALSAESGAMR